jgi:hypothetical protein
MLPNSGSSEENKEDNSEFMSGDEAEGGLTFGA